MITISILLIFFGSFVLYNTSSKVVLQHTFSLEKWIQSNTKLAKNIGLSIIILAMIPCIFSFGKTSGILYWFLLLSTVLSLIVILYPLKKINYKHLFIFFALLFILELINS